MEFGTKLDFCIDRDRLVRIEKLSFDEYNENKVLIGAIKRYHDHTSYYPERFLVDKIYRNRKNQAYCEEHWNRIAGLVLGRLR